MYDDISTKDLIKYLICSLFDGNENNPEFKEILAEVKKRTVVVTSPSAV